MRSFHFDRIHKPLAHKTRKLISSSSENRTYWLVPVGIVRWMTESFGGVTTGNAMGLSACYLFHDRDILGKRRSDELEFQYRRVQTAEEIATKVQHSINPDAIGSQILRLNKRPRPTISSNQIQSKTLKHHARYYRLIQVYRYWIESNECNWRD